VALSNCWIKHYMDQMKSRGEAGNRSPCKKWVGTFNTGLANHKNKTRFCTQIGQCRLLLVKSLVRRLFGGEESPHRWKGRARWRNYSGQTNPTGKHSDFLGGGRAEPSDKVLKPTAHLMGRNVVRYEKTRLNFNCSTCRILLEKRGWGGLRKFRTAKEKGRAPFPKG